MERLGRDAPLPDRMQGRWVDAGDASCELIVNGGEVICFGRPVAYDRKEFIENDGALSVNLEIDDEADEDTFQRQNLTGFIMTPEGEFHAYNVKFASQFVRPASGR